MKLQPALTFQSYITCGVKQRIRGANTRVSNSDWTIATCPKNSTYCQVIWKTTVFSNKSVAAATRTTMNRWYS